jgi:hypothetical protein
MPIGHEGASGGDWGCGKALGAAGERLPPAIRQNHRGFYLTVGDGPVLLEKPVFLLRRNHLKAVLFVEADCPLRGGLGADQHRAVCQRPQV